MGQLSEYPLTTGKANNQSGFYSSIYPTGAASEGSGWEGPRQKTELTKAGIEGKPSGTGNKPDLQTNGRGNTDA